MKKVIVFLCILFAATMAYAANYKISEYTNIDKATLNADDELLLDPGATAYNALTLSVLVDWLDENGLQASLVADTDYLTPGTAASTYQTVLTNPLVQADVDDTPVNGVTTAPVSSNWAYDHEAAADPHAGYVLESLYDAYSIIYADTDNTPARLTVDANRVVGRGNTGGISAIGSDCTDTLLGWNAAGVLGCYNSIGAIDMGGGVLEIPNGTSGTTDATGEIYLDTNGDGGTNFSGPIIQVYDGSSNKYLFLVDLPLAASQDNYVLKYDASGKTIQWEADATGGTTALDAIGDATADGTIAAGGYETTITSTLDETDHSVLTVYNTDDDRAANTALLTLKDDDGADANAFYLKLIGDADGTPVTDYSMSQTAFAIGSGIVTTFSGAVNLNLSTVIADSQTLTFDESAADPNDADVILSAADGVFKIAAANGANNEDITVDLDQTANTAIINSTTGITDVYSALPLRAPAKFFSYDAAQTLTAAVHNGAVVMLTVADEITMWDCTSSTIGHFVTLWPRDAEKIEVVPASGDQFYLLNGTGIGANDELDMAATAGAKVCLMCTAENEWRVFSEMATTTDGGTAD